MDQVYTTCLQFGNPSMFLFYRITYKSPITVSHALVDNFTNSVLVTNLTLSILKIEKKKNFIFLVPKYILTIKNITFQQKLIFKKSQVLNK